MVEDIHNYLRIYITQDGIPLKQVLTEIDLHQLSVSLFHITNSKANKAFEKVGVEVFEGLKEDKLLKALEYPILSIPFQQPTTKEEQYFDVGLLGYHCFMYLAVAQGLPVSQALLVLSEYFLKHIVNAEDAATINCSNPVSNLVPVSEDTYVRFDGRRVIPPTDAIKEEFIKQFNSLLIKQI